MTTIKRNLLSCSRAFIGFSSDVIKTKTSNAKILSSGGVQTTIKIYDEKTLLLAKEDGGRITGGTKKKKKKAFDDALAAAEVLMIIEISCKSLNKGDMNVAFKSPDGIIIATIDRQGETGGFLGSARNNHKGMKIPVLTPSEENEVYKTFAHVTALSYNAASSSKISLEGDDNTEVSFSTSFPICQPCAYWLCFSFLCFFPTFGIAAPIGFYKSVTSTQRTKVKRLGTAGEESKLKDAKKKNGVEYITIDFDGVSEWKEKLAMLILFGFIEADKITQPKGSGGGGGGDFGGGDSGGGDSGGGGGGE
eukprot:CAMPEP_0195537508 /NCGR_PEP_ID=MMETSP0794_2-20130614/48024_1 /TAXON_ID=515487 /ORGANISM="Stephanopyxis turris, Strain CCMP 815" /LENGTH=305 /DNA_ID=CAMNT_0040671235 /DNA_START=82 /DNA_END=999 /DNA_ORIENTATION=+